MANEGKYEYLGMNIKISLESTDLDYSVAYRVTKGSNIVDKMGALVEQPFGTLDSAIRPATRETNLN